MSQMHFSQILNPNHCLYCEQTHNKLNNKYVRDNVQVAIRQVNKLIRFLFDYMIIDYFRILPVY